MHILFIQVPIEQAGSGIVMLLSQIIILVSSIWVGIDSSKLELKKYKSGISYGPVVMVILCLLLWIVAFPWYLIVRGKIKAGTAKLK